MSATQGTETRAASRASADPLTLPGSSAARTYPRSPSRGRPQPQRRESLAAWALLAPALLALIVLRIYPVATAAIDSFSGSRGPTFANYLFLFHSPDFLQSFKTTILFNLIVNPFQIIVALALAVLLTRRMPGRSIWRCPYFPPVAMPLAVTAAVWDQLLAQSGLANGILSLFGIPAQGFFTSYHEALPSIIILASWIGCGIWMVFLIAGIQDIPVGYYDAALVDGAGPIQSFWHVTLPLLRDGRLHLCS